MSTNDEPSRAALRRPREADAATDQGWESVQGGRSAAATIELGPAADHVLIQSWRLLKNRNAKRD